MGNDDELLMGEQMKKEDSSGGVANAGYQGDNQAPEGE